MEWQLIVFGFHESFLCGKFYMAHWIFVVFYVMNG